jgi:hypothetical protein
MYTLQGKPDTHGTYTFHVNPRTPLVRFWQVVPVRGSLSYWPNRVGRILLLLRKSSPDSTSQPSWMAHGTHPSFSPNNNQWSNRLKPSIYWWTCYIGLLDLYHQHVISTFNTCSCEPTHWSLINTNGGYDRRGVGFPHHSYCPSQPTVLHFPPKCPVRSPIKQCSTRNFQDSRFLKPIDVAWSFDHTTIYRGLHIHLAKLST